MNTNIHILNAEPENYSDQARAIMHSLGNYGERYLTRGELLEAIQSVHVLIVRLQFQIDQALLDAGEQLRYIVSPTTGLDHIDLEYATKKGIDILSLRGQVEFLKTVRATAEHTVGIALALLRNIPAAVTSTQTGEWNRDLFRGGELYGKTAGIVGMGRLGTIVAGYLKSFGMNVLGYDPRPDFPEGVVERADTLHTLLERSDLISIHVAYNQSTWHLFDEAAFASIKPNALLINTSRGGIIDEAALLHALRSGSLSGAALDVLDGEPYVQNHPLVAYAQRHRNLLITPHIGGNTYESFIKTEVFMAEQLKKALQSEVN